MKTREMNPDWIVTARTLNTALPYLQRYAGATVVIKFGGNAMGDQDAMAKVADEGCALLASSRSDAPTRVGSASVSRCESGKQS